MWYEPKKTFKPGDLVRVRNYGGSGTLILKKDVSGYSDSNVLGEMSTDETALVVSMDPRTDVFYNVLVMTSAKTVLGWIPGHDIVPVT